MPALPTVGFWSYSRQDNDNASGGLSRLRAMVSAELKLQLGRAAQVELFQDTADIHSGAMWEQKIRDQMARSSFLIPILTPDFFQSAWCCKEVEIFQEREAVLGRGSLIFPIAWVATDAHDRAHAYSEAVWLRMGATQKIDLTAWRHDPLETTPEVRKLVDRLAQSIKNALRRPGKAPQPTPPIAEPARTTIVATPKQEPDKPSWASVTGTDRFGTWADLTIPAGGTNPATQRMRLIPAGRFVMGSPDDEAGRNANEGPLHKVTIAQPFWLFDTPCTQAFWQAAMGENPSHFKGPARPVENVSYNDVAGFLRRLNDHIPGLNLALPSEAQWEYACRAGTTGATYAGLGSGLSDIAWWSENSNKETHDVKTKTPNNWGLYDMLGNVWELCADGWQDNYAAAPADGAARPANGTAYRVGRGGSWFDEARYVRSAARGWPDPSGRFDNLGFRPSRVQTSD